MRKTIKINRPSIKNCGGKKGGKGCATWAGAAKGKTQIKVTA